MPKTPRGDLGIFLCLSSYPTSPLTPLLRTIYLSNVKRRRGELFVFYCFVYNFF